MLIVSAGYHTHTHKHADELGFCLFNKGTLLLAEAGKYGYDKLDPARTYAVSSQAHSVLIVDGESFMPLSIRPYGGALSRVAQGAGWFAVEGSNPLLTSQSVEHRRLFVYRPGVLLVIVDRVESSRPHEYTRLFHFAPGVSASLGRGEAVEFASGESEGVLRDQSGIEVNVGLVEGQRKPELAGWCFPCYREWHPIPTISLTASGKDLSLVTLISLTKGSRNCDIQIVNHDVVVSHSDSGQGEVWVSAHGTDGLRIIEKDRVHG